MRPRDRLLLEHANRVDFPALEAMALNLIRKQLLVEIGGPEKMQAVVDGLIAHLDKVIRPPQPIAEMVSDIILRSVFRPVLRGLAQAVYERMQREIVEREAKPKPRRRARKIKSAKP